VSEQKIRIGVIGCGHWGKNYVRLFSGMPGVELTAIADTEAAKRQAVAAAHGNPRSFASHSELIAAGVCDAVVVATVASTHYAVISEALRAGLDVLAEKPFTLKASEANELADQAEKGGRVLMVAHTFLFNSSVRQIKGYLDAGVVGDVYYAKARRTHLGLVRQDVNAVWDLAPHDVSMFLYLFGEKPCAVQAVGRRLLRNGREDAAFINLVFPSGIIANICVSWADANKERFLDISGSRARVAFDDLNVQEPIRIYHKGITVESPAEPTFGEFKYLLRDGDIVSPKVAVKEPLRQLCEDFLSALATRSVRLSDARFGAQVVEVLEDVQTQFSR